MGIIQKKSIQFTTINLAGVLIGMLSSIFIYPLAREAYGLARFFIDFAWLLYPLVLFGMDSVSLKYFPEYGANPQTKKNFLTFLLVHVVGVTALMAVLFFLFGNPITHWLDDNLGMRFHEDPLIEQFLWLILPTTFVTGVSMLLNRYLSSFHKISWPAILLNLIKLSVPILVLLSYTGHIDVNLIPYGVWLTYFLTVMGSFIILSRMGALHFNLDFSGFDKGRYKEMYAFSIFSLFTSLGSLIAFRIDTVMVGALLNLDLTGEFGIAATIAQIIAIPTNAIITVAAPIISLAWSRNDMNHIATIYKKASNNLLVPGLLIYTGMWVAVEHLFGIMPNSDTFIGAVWVVKILGLAKIIDMATSVNNEIIAYSKYYKFNFYAVLLLSVLNILFNLYFIRQMGITGAALATFLSLLIYNLAKLFFIRWAFGIHPFSVKTLYLVGIALFTWALTGTWTLDLSAFSLLLLKGTLVCLIFVPLCILLNVSEDLNDLVNKWSKRLFQIKN